MPRKRVADPRFDWRKGINLTDSEELLGVGELLWCINGRSDTGSIRTRRGSKRLHATVLPGGVLGLFQWDAPAPGTAKQLVAVAGGHFLYKAPAAPDFTDRGAGMTTTRTPRFSVFREGVRLELYIADGVLQVWDGTTLAAVPNAPAATGIAGPYLGRYLAIDGTKTLYYSAITAPEKWLVADGGGSAPVETYDSEGLVGLLLVGGSALLFKEGNISRFTGSSKDEIRIDSQTRGLAPDIGLLAPASLIPVDKVGFFLSERGAYFVTEAELIPATDGIRRAITDANRELWAKAVAVHNRRRGEVYLCVPDGAELSNLTCWTLNVRTRSWYGPWTAPFDFAAAAQYEQQTELDSLIFGGSDGFVREFDRDDVALDDVHSDGTAGAAVELDALPAPYLEGVPGRIKRCGDNLQVVTADLGVAGALTVYWTSEKGSGDITLASAGAGPRAYPFKLTSAAGQRLKIGFLATTPIEILGLDAVLTIGRGGRG